MVVAWMLPLMPIDVSGVNTEGWAFVTLVFTTIAGGIGYVVRKWSDTRVEKSNIKLKAEAEAAAAEAARAKDMADRLTAAQDRLITSSEKREAAANTRTDRAIDGLAALTDSLTKLLTLNQTMLEELRRVNAVK